MIDPFPEDMPSETIFYVITCGAVALMIAMCGVVHAVKVAERNAKPLETIRAGQAGDVLRVVPSLPVEHAL